MTIITRLALLAAALCLIITPAGLRAQDQASEKESAPAADSIETQKKDALGAFAEGGFDFSKIQAAGVDFTPDGAVRIIADDLFNVIILSDTMNLDCYEVTFNPETRILVATGKPVKVEQAQFKAECRTLTYDVEKKVTKLQGNPLIHQSVNGESTKMSADEITLYEGEDGNMGMTMSNKKESRKPILIERNVTKTTNPTTSTRTEPRRITQKNANFLKLPQPE